MGDGLRHGGGRGDASLVHRRLGICDFAAEHASANTASGNVIRKCGFQLVRRGTFAKFDGSETFDAAFYELHLKGDS